MTAKITFDSDRCKGCELCTAVCPKHIVAIDQDAITASMKDGLLKLVLPIVKEHTSRKIVVRTE